LTLRYDGVNKLDSKRLIEIIDKFKGKKILVIGDIMLDKYIKGEVSRISPEAPVQVVNVEREDYVPGGAANVATNIASLGGNVFIVGTVGNDDMAPILVEELKKRNINVDYLVKDATRPTITKMRVIARSQQLLRVDYEKVHGIDLTHQQKLLNELKSVIEKIDCVVLSDYGKGLVTKSLMIGLVDMAKSAGKRIIVDPKPAHREYYYDCNLLTPNYDEACQMCMLEPEEWKDIMKVGDALVKKYAADVLVTRGEKGMSLFMKNGTDKHIPTKAKEVYDVTGAGDTVVATLSIAISAGASLEEAAIIANHAAGIVVGKIGTSTVTSKEIKNDIRKDAEYNSQHNDTNGKR